MSNQIPAKTKQQGVNRETQQKLLLMFKAHQSVKKTTQKQKLKFSIQKKALQPEKKTTQKQKLKFSIQKKHPKKDSSTREENNTETEIKVQHPKKGSSTREENKAKRNIEDTTTDFAADSKRVFYQKKSNPDEIRVVDTDKQGNQTVQKGNIGFVSLETIKKTETGDYETNKDTYALPATIKEVQPGCFIIDKPKETEAGFCFECKRENGEEDSVLSSLLGDKNFTASLMNYLKKVRYNTKRKVSSQTVVSGNSIQKICSPEVSLKAIIKNFNKTCPQPYKNNFEAFFKKAYCESCKKGIPPEIMMAMMSVESAGRCPADSKNNREHSAGLFQINAKVHQCRDLQGNIYNKNTSANFQCLKDPIHNMNKSIDILFDHYGQVNEKAIDTSQCKSWLEMTVTERDTWRRGVSAYNSGPGWLTRAIGSARNKETLQNTAYLIGAQKKPSSKHKKDDVSWEKLRLYYFIERLSPGNKRATGRKLNLTISNLAHTEAVLGRNVNSSAPAMVEIWAQYKTEFLKRNKTLCSAN